MQRGVATITSIGFILGGYFAVDAWADEKITASEKRILTSQIEQQVRNEIDHSKILQSQRISTSEININIVEMKLAELEDSMDERQEEGKDPTARQERSMERMTKLLETYETEQLDATAKLTRITTTTTTTTTEAN